MNNAKKRTDEYQMNEESLLKMLSVVYVEDEYDVRKQIGRALARRVASVYLAENGAVGLDYIRKFKPHIVVTDLEMPVMNGLEMIEKIRAESDSNIPIIVITAYRDEEHYTNLANSYIYKPIIIQDLLETMVNLAHEYHLFE